MLTSHDPLGSRNGYGSNLSRATGSTCVAVARTRSLSGIGPLTYGAT
jgi:hypothetical protein